MKLPHLFLNPAGETEEAEAAEEAEEAEEMEGTGETVATKEKEKTEELSESFIFVRYQSDLFTNFTTPIKKPLHFSRVRHKKLSS